MIKRLLFFLIFFVSVQCFSQCTLQLTSVSVSCYGGTDGEITAYASNGAPGGYFLFQRYFLGNPLIIVPSTLIPSSTAYIAYIAS